MPNDRNSYISREEFEEFKENVVNLLGPLTEAFDKSILASKNNQASIDNLTQIIEALADINSIDSERLEKIEKLLVDLHNRSLNP